MEFQATEMNMIYAALGFGAGAFVAALILLPRLLRLERANAAQSAQGAEMENRFKTTAQEALQAAHEAFLQLAESRIKQTQAESAFDLERRSKAVDDLVKPVQKKLEELSGALEQIKGTDTALRNDLQSLQSETRKLAGALRNPALRGAWGESMLEQLLQNSGLVREVHYTMQTTIGAVGGSGVQRPDVVINLPDSLHIVIDSKVPVGDYMNALDADADDGALRAAQAGLAQKLRTHINDLGKKAYWESLDGSPDFVVLFLPSEHLFSAAIQADPGLLDLAAERRVIVASPILTMALLRVVGLGWRQVKLAQNAEDISRKGADLYKRLLTFTRHVEKIGTGLRGAMKVYDDAIGSFQNVLPAARRFGEMLPRTGAGDELPPFDEPAERAPRPLTLAAEDQEALKLTGS